MIPAHVEVETNINTAMVKIPKLIKYIVLLATMKEVKFVVELDQFKYTLTTYEKPLIEMGDSL